MAILVIPGKSIRVRSGQVWEKTCKTIGLSTMLVSFPHNLSVKLMILSLTSANLVNFLPGISSGNTPYGVIPSSMWLRRNSSGRLVTTPEPRGKKSRPTIDSKTEDLPADWEPKTAILGKLMYFWRPQSLNSSYRRSLNSFMITYDDSNKLPEHVVHELWTFITIINHLGMNNFLGGKLIL